MPETVSVRKVNGLPRASFSRNLAVQALPLAMCLAPPPALRDFHPVESAHAERTSRTVKAFEALTVLQTQALTISGHYYLEFVKEPCSIKTALLKRHGNIIVDRQIVGG